MLCYRLRKADAPRQFGRNATFTVSKPGDGSSVQAFLRQFNSLTSLSLVGHGDLDFPTILSNSSVSGIVWFMYSKSNLGKLKKMDVLAPEVMKAFWAFDKAAMTDGAIPVKYKELIAVAVAHTTQCPYCIDVHAGNARKAGATDAELVEAAMVAAALRAGAAVTHATHALSD